MSGIAMAVAATHNGILAGLPEREFQFLQPDLTRVTLVSHQVLHEAGARIVDAYFMESGVASLTADTADVGQVEVGLTGPEGMVGVSAVLNAEARAVHRAFIQVAGSALRIQVAQLRAAMEQCPVLRERCLLYAQFLMVQASQVAACNARHGIFQRLARWLLMTRDRIESDDVPMTQDFLSVMLGVRRASVAQAISALEAKDVIRHGRGRVRIIDRPKLEAEACNCYQILRKGCHDILDVHLRNGAEAAPARLIMDARTPSA
jgi:CRP-like cAMP-binding protein